MPPPSHPQAKFDPIPPHLDLHALVDHTPNFEWVLRISTAQIQGLGPQEFERLVQLQVIQGGKPLVIEKWNDVLPQWLFSGEWMEKTYDKKQENVRDITGQTEIPMTTGHYMRAMKQLTDQWTPSNYRDERRQRLYLKDIDCPPEWHEHLQKVIPPNLFYMNGNVTHEGAADPRADDVFRGFGDRTKVAPAGDLMSSLPEEMRAQNLMCYIGHEGTFTPAHREMCASLGQNIMVEASGSENGEKPGSSIWFMTETKDREVVREYFLSMLGHDIEIEKHFAQINAWKKATFPVYIVEQKPGDFILIPPLAPHQVWNRGTRSMKVAWNRTTVETLDMALHEALPKARLVCRDEQYKNKAIIYYTLRKYFMQMVKAEQDSEMGIVGLGSEIFRSSSRYKQLAKDFRHLFSLYTEILVDEMFATKEKNVEYVEYDSCVTCSYCRSNIFNRFLTCKHCVRTLVNGDEDAYDVCMECYAMGRSCVCISKLQWCEQWSWEQLTENYELWRAMVIKNDGFVDMELSPQPLEIARTRRGKKALAEICQEGLHRRPFKDISRLDEDKPLTESEPEPELDDNGKPKKRKYKRKKKKGELRRCHVCCHKDYAYKVQVCSNPECKEGYCYGVLYRAFDQMPQTVQENENWLCPKCLGICNCGACRRAESGIPYTPKNTLLGHDTRAIADDRSVEALVDFRVHNLNWLKTAGEEGRSTNSKRMKELREKADTAKAQENASLTAEDIANGAHGANSPAKSVEGGMNGYGDQSHTLGGQDEHQAQDQSDLSANRDMSRMDIDQSAPLADMSMDAEWDQTAYPDPLGMDGQRMFGMGYYEQSGPDQILFDPFQMPSPDAMVFDEEAEFVKNMLRAQKRKAKHENDHDPDFNGPKSHTRKKSKKDDSADESAMDPALFGSALYATAGAASDAVEGGNGELAGVSVGPEEEASVQLEREAVQAGNAGNAGNAARRGPPAPQFPANVPSLRHARPRASYAEPEEPMIDDPDDMVPAFKQRPPVQNDEPQTGDGSTDPLDLASDAIRALIQKGTDAAAANAAAAESETPRVPKRRGRPPRSVNSTTASVTRVDTVQKPSPADLAARNAAKKREERASRRSGLGRVVTIDGASSFNPRNKGHSFSDDDDDADDANAAHDVTEAELEAQLDRELAGEGPSQNAAVNSIETVTTEATTTAQPLKRRRGRPPKNKTAAAETEPADRSPPPPPAGATNMMSMAARVAARGGKFKITSRKSRDASANETPTRTQASSEGPSIDRSEQQAKIVPSIEEAIKPAKETSRAALREPSVDLTPPPPGASRERQSSSDHTPPPPGAVGRRWRKSGENQSDFVARVASPSSASSSDSGIPADPPPPVRRGRPSGGLTVVRIGSESESESEISSSSESESGLDDVEPGRLRGGSSRGRGSRGRGRGRPRGRGRGRGRGF
ncbi:AT hook domain-containing protein [Colletotrichum orchidophilum]|uniref:AT hook domain-containing protein n=1 Tax=Colletotrichum orchidophilum TaxID=1209926 RepID=A0A1G4B4E4_9PEZI|nr:AT hook domain-containing protein [Colletotrichum orchidophilum]OHE96185.1 AT hook domain-containing protein [Colletotrichum orchidophilum]